MNIRDSTLTGKRFAGWMIVLLCPLVGSCQRADHEPARPVGLPQAAVYAGGVDGGEWSSCMPTDDNRIVCTIFDPKDGTARFEKSYRICPAMLLIVNRVSNDFRARFIDAELALFDGAPAFVDRPVTYIPRPSDTDSDVEHQRELSSKYFRNFGVTADCKPMSTKPGVWQ